VETGLDPQRLEVEITEGVLFEDFERTLAILRRIKGLLARQGCQVQGYLIGRPEPIAHYRHLVAGLAGARETIVGAR
jgi:EAL domain-containing protein (putative c-di-GMP-specific phosphodiesterase class I)